jgi:hypothetical protein
MGPESVVPSNARLRVECSDWREAQPSLPIQCTEKCCEMMSYELNPLLSLGYCFGHENQSETLN